MMNVCPICSETLENTMRATMSFAPAGGNGTITRTGLAGKAWDQAMPAAQSVQAKNAANSRAAFILFLLVVAALGGGRADYRRSSIRPGFSISAWPRSERQDARPDLR